MSHKHMRKKKGKKAKRFAIYFGVILATVGILAFANSIPRNILTGDAGDSSTSSYKNYVSSSDTSVSTENTPESSSSEIPVSSVEEVSSIVSKAETSSVKKTTATSSKKPTVTSKPSVVKTSGYRSVNEGDRINVGTKYVAEVTSYATETFFGSTTGNKSNPQNSYLPKGTVDYCSPTISDSAGKFRALRYGKRVREECEGEPQIKVYEGKLPETNTLSLFSAEQTRRYTKLKFNVDWKAPFLLGYGPQATAAGEMGNYSVSEFTATYIKITFFYAVGNDANIVFPSDNPIFTSGSWSTVNGNRVLTLKLRTKGKFRGWQATYDSDGHLVFDFLNPYVNQVSSPISEVDILSGDPLEETVFSGDGELAGAVIVIDAGHGGRDCGAIASDKKHYESNINLDISKKLKSKLESMGAKVVMTRQTDVFVSSMKRIETAYRANADYCISIHHDWNASGSLSGYATYYFTAFSKAPSNLVFNTVQNIGIFPKTYKSGCKCHYFFLCRMTGCPSVLTENGFISNSGQLSTILNNTNTTAEGIANAISKYLNGK